MDHPKQKEQAHIGEEGNDIHLMAEKMALVEVQQKQPHNRRRLALELECQIFKSLPFPIQCKFIWGMGRAIYGIFGHKLLKQTKRLCNPQGNHWQGKGTNRVNFIISEDGLSINASNTPEWNCVIAEQPFSIHSRVDKFPGIICYYYEISVLSFRNKVCVGLSDGTLPVSIRHVGAFPDFYAIRVGSQEYHYFDLPEGAIRPERKPYANVYGCGLLMDPNDNVVIFFTLNGKLLDEGKTLVLSGKVIWKKLLKGNW